MPIAAPGCAGCLLVWRARDEEAPADPNPEYVRYAEYALNLLWHWNGPIPAATAGNEVDAAALTAWVTAVRTKLAAEGRKEI